MHAEIFPPYELILTCRIPFPGAEVIQYEDPGEFFVSKTQDGGAQINKRRVNLWLSKAQLVFRAQLGYQLRAEMNRDRHAGLSTKILDYFIDNPHHWPESWKKDQWGCTPRVCFWGGIFRYLWMDSLYVCCGHWNGHGVIPGRLSLGDEFDTSIQSAIWSHR